MSNSKVVKIEAGLVGKYKIESKLGKHNIYIDQPESAGGTDAGPNPLEFFLLSIAGCMISIARIAALQKNIKLKTMKVEVEGELNRNALLGKDPEARAGFQKILIRADIDADISLPEKELFLREVESRCPVADNVLKPTEIELIVN